MENIVVWLSQTGWKIFLVLAITGGIYLAIHHFVPIAIRRAVKRQMKRKRKAEIEKRADTSYSDSKRRLSCSLRVNRSLPCSSAGRG